MDDIVLKKPVLVSHDRGGCRITVSTTLLPSDIKRLLYSVSDDAKNIYVPSEITQEANSYSFYIRQRQSVKEYLMQHECTVSDYAKLIQSVAELIEVANSLNKSIYDFIFDYSCVYTGQSLDSAEYVYAPGGNMNKRVNSIADMLTIASLHIQCEDNIKEANALKEASSILAEWEKAENHPFPLEELLAVINIEQRDDKVLFTTWKPFLYFQFAMILSFVFILSLIPFKENGVFVWIAWLLLMVSIDYLLIPGKKLSKIRLISDRLIEIRGSGFLKGQVFYMNRGDINIGRDSKWADILVEHMLVSRHHAVICCKEKDIYIKDLNSKNGTYINNVRINMNEEVFLKKGSKISIGDKENIIRVVKT